MAIVVSSVSVLSEWTADEAICLDWYDYDGGMQKYHYLQLDDEITQDTFVTHPWCFRRQDGTPFAVFTNETPQNGAVILMVNADLSIVRTD